MEERISQDETTPRIARSLEQYEEDLSVLIAYRRRQLLFLTNTDEAINDITDSMVYANSGLFTTVRYSGEAKVYVLDDFGKEGGFVDTGETVLLGNKLMIINRASFDPESETILIMGMGELEDNRLKSGAGNAYLFPLDPEKISLFIQCSYGDFSFYDQLTDEEILKIKTSRNPFFERGYIWPDEETKIYFEQEKQTVDTIIADRGL